MSWLKPRPTRIFKRRQRLPGSMNLNRPLQKSKTNSKAKQLQKQNKFKGKTNSKAKQIQRQKRRSRRDAGATTVKGGLFYFQDEQGAVVEGVGAAGEGVYFFE